MEEADVEADLQIKIYTPTSEEFAVMEKYIEFLAKDSGIENGICEVSFQCFDRHKVCSNLFYLL